jgi:hypothetical protein
MKCSIISTAAIMAILPALGAAGPVKRQQVITADDLANAVSAWQADTATVSSFLNNAASYTDDATFIEAAQIALNAENDELTHKAVIDALFLNVNPDIANANNVLVGEQTFANVVAELQDMVNNGLAAIGDVDIINANRCPNVLPAIDTYFAVVEESLTTSPQGLDIPVPVGGAIRPVACGGPQQ